MQDSHFSDDPLLPDASRPADAGDAEPASGGSPWRFAGALVAVLVLLAVLLTATGRMDTLAQNLLATFREAPAAPAAPEPERVTEVRRDGLFTFRDLDTHPDRLFQPYTSGALVGDSSSAFYQTVTTFRELLQLYEQRMSVDDNFTVRVVDNRTNELLELYSLEEQRARHQRLDDTNWYEIDRMRRAHTSRLVDKYAARGIPRDAITVKWGRANQVREAREREASTIEYEIRLARSLGLSLLPTEIGTQETFNQDRLVSSVGARSRYQMMPYVLRKHDVHHYDLPTAAGRNLTVYEEWHPLLTLEPAFRELRGYINAVGHEMPGLSAYHAGPGNIYMLYRRYLANRSEDLNAGSTVLDAYMWAVTDGFETVTKGTSFGPHSRAYVASAYGALKGAEDLPIDTSRTWRTERVRLANGKAISLSTIVGALDEAAASLRWGGVPDSLATYERFRILNPHIPLPPSETGTVPTTGDARFVSSVRGAPVRFFLPRGGSAALEAAGHDVLDASATFVFDDDTFASIVGGPGERTMWDFQYDQLVEDISRFGFTRENRRRLYALETRFEELAEANPTTYREMQLDIIRTHKGLWATGVWENLADVTAAAQGRLQAPAAPPAEIGLRDPGLSRPPIVP